jgi:hypothetical protein
MVDGLERIYYRLFLFSLHRGLNYLVMGALQATVKIVFGAGQ